MVSCKWQKQREEKPPCEGKRKDKHGKKHVKKYGKKEIEKRGIERDRERGWEKEKERERCECMFVSVFVCAHVWNVRKILQSCNCIKINCFLLTSDGFYS